MNNPTTTAKPSSIVSTSAPTGTLCSTPAPNTLPLAFDAISELYQLNIQLRKKIDDQQAEIDALMGAVTALQERRAS